MSTIKSSTEHLTLNADGSGKDIKFQANGVEKASISSVGAFTSTSIDATKLSGALPALDGSALTGVGGGKVLQIVQSTKSTATSTTSGSLVDANLSATITPSSTSSKILCLLSSPNGADGGGDDVGTVMALLRGSTEISRHIQYVHGGAEIYGSQTINYLDSPSTTSATTYKAQFAAYGGGTSRFVNSTDYSASLILMEIGA